MTPTARVRRISIAPVKSLRVVHPGEVLLSQSGVAGDRRFFLTDASGRLYNGKRDGRLVQVRPDWDEASRRLRLTFPGGAVVDGAVELGDEVTAELGTPVTTRRVHGPWAAALSELLGATVALNWADEPLVDRRSRDGSVTLVSTGSLERLRAEAGADEAVDGRRFRMLFEVEGLDAHGEDEWLGRRVRVGTALVTISGDVGRCVVTTRDPETGSGDLDTLRVLAGYRLEGVTEPLPFGVYGSVLKPGRVRVGDDVAPA